jgi:hypothetical protein
MKGGSTALLQSVAICFDRQAGWTMTEPWAPLNGRRLVHGCEPPRWRTALMGEDVGEAVLMER